MRINRILQEKTRAEQSEIDLSLLDSVINKTRGKKGNVIPLLQAAQSLYGYLPDTVFEKSFFVPSVNSFLPQSVLLQIPIILLPNRSQLLIKYL